MEVFEPLLALWIVVTAFVSTICLGLYFLVLGILKMIKEKKYIAAILMLPTYLLGTFLIAFVIWMIGGFKGF